MLKIQEKKNKKRRKAAVQIKKYTAMNLNFLITYPLQ